MCERCRALHARQELYLGVPGTTPPTPDTPQRNDQVLIAQMERDGRLPDAPGMIVRLDVRHDSWCPFLAGQPSCTCSPTIVAALTPTTTVRVAPGVPLEVRRG